VPELPEASPRSDGGSAWDLLLWSPPSPKWSDSPVHRVGVAADTPNVVDRDRVLKDIRNAWLAAYASAVIMVVAVLAAVFARVPLHGADHGSALEIAILVALAFGVHMKSRGAAVVLLGYFVAFQVLLRAGLGMGLSGLFVVVLLGYFYVRGVAATFAYHRIDAGADENEGRPLVPARSESS
jgi:hypothetical protein